MGMRIPDPAFWRRQRVFVTGHTGFKGGWLAIWLHSLGAETFGYALAPDTDASLYDTAGIGSVMPGCLADILDADRLAAEIAAFRPTVVIHMAAQALVRRSYREPALNFATNVMGTVNLLEAVRATPGIGASLIVTSDKCYESQDIPCNEADRLGGRDPYSASKACAELVTQSYFWSFFRAAGGALASGRAGNVIGGGDRSEDRLVPDLIRAFAEGRPAVLRNPGSIRPWQHVLEPLNGYLLTIEHIFGGTHTEPLAWNFGPDLAGNRDVAAVANAAAAAWGPAAQVLVRPDPGQPHESPVLQLDSAKARAELSWAPRWGFDAAVERTVDWYRAVSAGADARAMCERQIAEFVATPVQP